MVRRAVAGAVPLVALWFSLGSCSFVERASGHPAPCDPADRTVVEAATLDDAEPSAAFEITDGFDTFVMLVGDPGFNSGAGLNGGLVHASVYVIEDGEAPQESFIDDDGFRRSSPDYRLVGYGDVGESRFVDQPNGQYRLWSTSGPIVEVFRCDVAE